MTASFENSVVAPVTSFVIVDPVGSFHIAVTAFVFAAVAAVAVVVVAAAAAAVASCSLQVAAVAGLVDSVKTTWSSEERSFGMRNEIRSQLIADYVLLASLAKLLSLSRALMSFRHFA